MGLLDRVRTLDSITTSVTNASIINSFRHSPESIDFPGAVFKAAQSLAGFAKGALLLPDPREKIYYPWISIGFDRTTTRRLRIPEDFPALKAGDKSLITVNSEDFTEMLSNRELGLIKDMIIIRLGPKDAPSALLLASDLPESGISLEVESELQVLSTELGGGITQSRLMLDRNTEDEIADLSEWLSSWGMGKAVLVTLDITNALDSLMDSITGLELYRARKDVVNLIRHLTGRMGRLHDLKDGRVLILFPEERLSDYELYLHHLSRSFASLFFNLSHPPDFPAVFNLWPEEKETIEESLSGFF